MTCAPAWLAVCGNRGGLNSSRATSSLLTFTGSGSLICAHDPQVMGLASSLPEDPSKNETMPMAIIPSAGLLRGTRLLRTARYGPHKTNISVGPVFGEQNIELLTRLQRGSRIGGKNRVLCMVGYNARKRELRTSNCPSTWQP